MRSYLQFLETQGLCRPGLAGAVPTIRSKPAGELTRYAEEESIEALIASCDPSTPAGLLDPAILLLLARLALRAGEITAVHPGDTDWRQALVTIRGKGRRGRLLPLWPETRAALRQWLGVRPDSNDLHLVQNAFGKGLTRRGFAKRVDLQAETAAHAVASIADKRVLQGSRR